MGVGSIVSELPSADCCSVTVLSVVVGVDVARVEAVQAQDEPVDDFSDILCKSRGADIFKFCSLIVEHDCSFEGVTIGFDSRGLRLRFLRMYVVQLGRLV